MDKLTWHNERRKVDELLPYPQNPRMMTQEQAKQLRASLEKFDLVEVPAINTDNVIVAGHMRLKTLQLLGRGAEEIDVRVPSRPLTEDELREYNLRSNKNTGGWDYDLLAGFDSELLLEIGWSKDELQKIFDIQVAEVEEPPAVEPMVKLGDMYKLGRHRLICGDSTDRTVVERVMQGELADMVFTDPPYNVNYCYAKYEGIHKGRKRKFIHGDKLFNDNKSEEQFYHFLLDVFKHCYDFTKDSAAIYICFSTKSDPAFRLAMEDAGYLFSQTIIWLKERIILAHGQDYHRIYEPIMFGWKKGKKHYGNKMITTEQEFWTLDRQEFEEQLDVWFEARDKSADYEHPTQKPVRLAERAIKKSSQADGILFEPFGGSGSTLLACEQLQRSCRAVELDPAYCDVIIGRWEKLTGLKAEKV